MNNPMQMFGNMNQMMQRFQQFRQGFQGDPQQQLAQLMQSGKVTQDQLNQAQQMAQQCRSMFNL